MIVLQQAQFWTSGYFYYSIGDKNAVFPLENMIGNSPKVFSYNTTSLASFALEMN